jgi:hypothetical protein
VITKKVFPEGCDIIIVLNYFLLAQLSHRKSSANVFPHEQVVINHNYKKFIMNSTVYKKLMDKLLPAPVAFFTIQLFWTSFV